MESAIQNAKIVPNIFSDHSAITLSMSCNETKHGPGFWKFNNSLLMDKCYTEMITKKIPEFISEYCNLNDKVLFWEMIKMEIRASTIVFAKKKAKQKQNEEKDLILRLNRLQEKLSTAQWYEFGEKNNKYFYNLEKINHKKKHITSLTKEDGDIVHEPKQILDEEERFCKEIYQSKNVPSESANHEHFLMA